MIDSFTPNYLATTLDSLHKKNQDRASQIIGGGRYSIDNADQADTNEGHWLKADRARENQLGLLQQKLTDPTLFAGINKQATANQDAQNAATNQQYRSATGKLRSSLASRGLQGSGLDAGQTAQNDAQLQIAKAKAATMADEIRQAGITGLKGIEKSLVDRIMAEDDNGQYGTQLDQLSGNNQAAELQSQLNDQYGSLLSNTLAGVVTNTVSPFVNTGFDAADRANEANTYAGKPTNYTWWNMGNNK